jgi:hypothetical protein
VVNERSIAIILIDSPDGSSVIPPEDVEALVWDNGWAECDYYSVPPYSYAYWGTLCSVDLWWNHGTYGIVEFVKDSNFATYPGPDIFGPYLSEYLAADEECHGSDWVIEATAAVIADENAPDQEELEAFDHLVFVLPHVDPEIRNGCWWGASGNSCNTPGGCGDGWAGKWVILNAYTAANLAHELGHNLGLHHLSDTADNQGPGGRVIGFNGPSLLLMSTVTNLDILPSSSVVEVSSNDTVVLLPLYSDPYDYPGTRIIKIPVPYGAPYYIEFRDAGTDFDDGPDWHLLEADQLTARINRWDGTQYITAQTYMGKIGDGETYTDPNRTFSIEVTDLSQGAEHLEMTIEVTFLYTGVLAYQEPN